MDRPNPKRQIIFGLLIALLFILLAVLVYWLLNFPQEITNQAATPTSTGSSTPTITPSILASLTSTPPARPTWTLRPRASSTSTLAPSVTSTVTRTRLPVLAKAKPYKYNDRYDLTPWNAEAADYVARLMMEEPDNRYPTGKQSPTTAYGAAFKYAVYAYREALLRFPEDENTSTWKWRLAYAMAQTGDPQAGEYYASFIAEAVNRLQLFPDALPGWFTDQEPNLTLYATSLPSSILSVHDWILEIKEAGVFLLLRQSSQEVFVYPLATEFNFINGNSASWITGDPNQDGAVEVIIYLPDPSDNTHLTTPLIYDLSKENPQTIPIEQSVPFSLEQPFKLTLNTQIEKEQTSLILSALIYPACPVTYQRTYRWQDGMFSLTGGTFNLAPVPGNLVYCDVILEHALTVWGAQASLPLLETLLPLWPPTFDPQGFAYPVDALDKLKYQASFALAFTGDLTGAVSMMNEIINSPSTVNSAWIKPAQQFLATYKKPQDLYQACSQSSLCIPRQALDQIVMESGTREPGLTQDFIIKAGVPLRSAGLYDFDVDGINERWLTVQHHPGEKLEFWILAQDDEGIVHALFVARIDTGDPQPRLYPYAREKPVVLVGDRLAIRLDRLPEHQEPYIVFPQELEPAANPYTLDQTLPAVEALLAGSPSQEIRDKLLAVLDSGRFNCIAFQLCDLFYYSLGLAYELSGNEREAVDTYIQLWWENSSSPYTSMARLKLNFIQFPTPTPLPTATSTSSEGTPYP